MVDFLGQKLVDGDVIAFATRSGSSATMKIAVVIDAANMMVWSAERYYDRWNISSKAGKIERENKVVKISQQIDDSEEAWKIIDKIEESCYGPV